GALASLADSDGSERNIVVREVASEVVRLGRRRFLARRVLAGSRARGTFAASATATALAGAAATEHLHLIGDDVGEVFFHAVLAGVLVVADRAFDLDLATLAQVLAGDLAELAEQLHPVPFGALLGDALAVLAHAGGGEAEGGHGHAALGVLGFV